MKTSVLVFSVILLGAAAQADVDLEWQVENQGAPVGETVRIDFYAVADNGGGSEPFVSLQAIVVWDPDFLRLLGVDDSDSPYDWMLSGFPSDAHADGLNDTFDDGDAYYAALANFGELPEATPEGLLVTTFEFEALAATEGTDVVLLAEYGDYSVTAVYDDEVPGYNIVGDLGSATVEISSAGCVGDIDGDGDTDHSDLGELLAAWCTHEGDPNWNPNADLDGDGHVGHGDLGILLADWGCGT